MKTPTLYQIAEKLNELAQDHPIGELQEIRGRGGDLFRINAKSTQDEWAYHWGGRTELQFNICLVDGREFRHGVAFSFKESREYKANELMLSLRPIVERFNRFMRKHPKTYADMQ